MVIYSIAGKKLYSDFLIIVSYSGFDSSYCRSRAIYVIS